MGLCAVRWRANTLARANDSQMQLADALADLSPQHNGFAPAGDWVVWGSWPRPRSRYDRPRAHFARAGSDEAEAGVRSPVDKQLCLLVVPVARQRQSALPGRGGRGGAAGREWGRAGVAEAGLRQRGLVQADPDLPGGVQGWRVTEGRAEAKEPRCE